MNRDALEQIALDLGAKPRTVAKWRQRHVPYKWRLLIEDEARRRGAEIDRRLFENDAPATAPDAAAGSP